VGERRPEQSVEVHYNSVDEDGPNASPRTPE